MSRYQVYCPHFSICASVYARTSCSRAEVSGGVFAGL